MSNRPESRNSVSSNENKSHDFVIETFNSWTYCDVCSRVLWGLSKQGFQCKNCGMCVHRKCEAEGLKRKCDINASLLNKTPKSIKSPTSIASPSPSSSEAGSLDIYPNSKQPNAVSKRSKDSVTLGQQTGLRIPVEKDQSVLDAWVKSTARSSLELEQSHKKSKPPLNMLTTTPKNFTRFVCRTGGIADFQDATIDILMWVNPAKTLFALILYSVICLYPSLLILVPQMMTVYAIVDNYYIKTKKDMKKGGLMKKNLVKDNNKSSDKSKKEPSVPTPNNVQYFKNLQWIQNSMGMFTDMYDAALVGKKAIDWSDEDITLGVLKNTVMSMFGVVIILRFISLNIFFMIGGWLIVLQNTAIFRAAVAEIPPRVAMITNSSIKELARLAYSELSFCIFSFFSLLKEYIDTITNKNQNKENFDENKSTIKTITPSEITSPIESENNSLISTKTLTVEETVENLKQYELAILFENQRRWESAGWISHTLPNERVAWTDVTGLQQLPPRKEFKPDVNAESVLPQTALEHIFKITGNDRKIIDETILSPITAASPIDNIPFLRWEWKWAPETEWRIDVGWSKHLDSHGWQYLDENWKHPRSEATDDSKTRRRMWIRQMIRVPVIITEEEAKTLQSQAIERTSVTKTITDNGVKTNVTTTTTSSISTKNEDDSPVISRVINIKKESLKERRDIKTPLSISTEHIDSAIGSTPDSLIKSDNDITDIKTDKIIKY